MDFRSVFLETLGRILDDQGLEKQAFAFMNQWQAFVFKGEQDGEFMTVREDFATSLQRVLGHLGIEGDHYDYSHSVIGDMFESLRIAVLFDEVPEVLETIESRDIPWAIVSNVDEDDMQAIIRHHGLRPKASISSEAVEAYKPDPKPFSAAITDLGLNAKKVLHVGDSPEADVAGARTGGIDAIWVNRYGDVYPRDIPEPLMEVEDLSTLPRLLR